MHTLCIHYVLDPDRAAHFRTYVHHELGAIRRSGGRIIGCFLPTDFAGPTNEAYGLIEFETLASYEQYRNVLANDLRRHFERARPAANPGAVFWVHGRTFFVGAPGGRPYACPEPRRFLEGEQTP